MALVDNVWYVNFGNGTSTGYYAVTVRPQNTAVAAGVLRRQFTAPAVGSERVFVCIVAGTTANVTDATWGLTRGVKTTDGTATWMECTGQAGLNGDLTNTATWAQVKAATPAVLGQVIKRSNNASYQICTTAGAMSASEPAFSDTAGTTTTDTTAVWTSLGPVANFTGGQAPFARLASACVANWFVAGNTIYVGDNHAETQASAMSINPNVSHTAITKIICADSTKYPPASGDLKTTATVTTTGANILTFQPSAGSIYVYGIQFSGGGGPVTQGFNFSCGNSYVYLDACLLKHAGTTGSAQTLNAATAGIYVLNNTTVYFGAVADYLDMGVGTLIWQNTGPILAAGSAVPTNLLGCNTTGRANSITLEALDLSQITGNLNNYAVTSQIGTWLIKDCKLNAATSVQAVQHPGQTIQLVRCDNATKSYRSDRYQHEGAETTEITITRVGGATDPAGQVQSRKIVTTANAQWLRPFKAEPYAVWNATTGANVTVTVYGTGAALPNNDDIWLEVEYLGSASTTLGSTVTTTKANLLATNAAVASDSSTWGGGTTPFKLTTTLSSPQPGQAGYIHARIRVGKASATYYIDPQVYLS